MLTLTPAQKQAGDVALPCNAEPNLSDLNTLKRMTLGQTSTQCYGSESSSNNASTQSAFPLRLRAVDTLSSSQGVRFFARGEGIHSVQITVFDLSGHTLFTGTANGTSLLWPLLTDRGQRVANGVYFAVLRARGADDRTLSTMKKIAVVR